MKHRFPTHLQFGTLAGLAAGLSGCISVPPQPERPAGPDLAPRFSTTALYNETVDERVGNWWEQFEDSALTAYIERALRHNPQLKLAEANIETSRAIYAARGLDLTPSTSSNASASIDRAARAGANTDLTLNGALAASWEYDAFGRLAAQIESAAFDIEALAQIRRDLGVTIAAETALAYTALRGNQTRLAVAESNAGLQAESLGLLTTLFENGRATRLDMERAESQYRTTLASLPTLVANIEIAKQQLIALGGQVTGDQTADPLPDRVATIPAPQNIIAIGNPAALLRRRPDIRAAEAEIASRLALSSAERARLFPTLTFNANIFSLFAESKAFENSFGFGLGPALSWEGPDLRRVRADIEISDARTKAAYANYEAVVVAAISEVETALIGYAQEQARQANLETAALAARRAVDLSRLRFEEGLDDFLDVIDAQRTLLDSQDRLESSRIASTQQAIAIYRALGGIWSTDTFNARPSSGETNYDS